MNKITINTDFIQLDQFLKWAGVVESGGQVKIMVDEGIVFVNNNLETARRRKLKNGDVVKIKEIGSWQVVTGGE
ncbi:RNA-binding S4 domain-containing protein [Anaerovibrio sp.]|uniref:RNA-binding S4 domain-containing protein n=1 Tax=Anaerovibrio sp. TaxID=1872532 RepID=UPI0025FCA660|nr:RNA-binding S4 domain-containing protein [Anaerovibrio sp.]